MDSIKRFFDKKKKDAKFKLAGEGKTLASTSKHRSSSSNKSRIPPRSGPTYESRKASGPTSESKKASAAALARKETQGPLDVDWSLQAIKAQAKREMEAERKLADLQLQDKGSDSPLTVTPKETQLEAAPMLAVRGVYFFCTLIGPEVETYDVIKAKIREFLFCQLGEDQAIASCLIIHTCNKNKGKVSLCIETLCKYIENIISNPNEEKYRKIRQSNHAYQERIACMEGTKEFLEAAGFESRKLPFNETTDQFWVFSEDKSLDSLEDLRNALISVEPLRPQLDRSLRVLLPKEATQFTDLPKDFFTITAEEVKKEQQTRTEEVERTQMLMTKAMREKLQLRELRKYRFTLIRIKFPDGIILQGTFAINEKFSILLEFVRENLTNGWRPFFLTLSGGGKVTEEESSLFELHLVPAVLFNFEWDSTIQDPDLDDRVYLTDEVMMLLHANDEVL